MLIIEDAHQKVVFRLESGVEFHVAIDADGKLKVQCASEVGAPAMSVEPKADNTVCITHRI